jgi:hypothetical protein
MSKINVKVFNDHVKDVLSNTLKYLQSEFPILNVSLNENEVVNNYIIINDIVDGVLTQKRIHMKNIIGYEFERTKKPIFRSRW